MVKLHSKTYTKSDYEHERNWWLHSLTMHRARFRVHGANVRKDTKADQHQLCSIRKRYYKASA